MSSTFTAYALNPDMSGLVVAPGVNVAGEIRGGHVHASLSTIHRPAQEAPDMRANGRRVRDAGGYIGDMSL